MRFATTGKRCDKMRCVLRQLDPIILNRNAFHDSALHLFKNALRFATAAFIYLNTQCVFVYLFIATSIRIAFIDFCISKTEIRNAFCRVGVPLRENALRIAKAERNYIKTQCVLRSWSVVA
jgi:hypothetical protein